MKETSRNLRSKNSTVRSMVCCSKVRRIKAYFYSEAFLNEDAGKR